MKAWVLPGKTRSWARVAGRGCTTLTLGIAAWSVASTRREAASGRVWTPQAATTAIANAAAARNTRTPRGTPLLGRFSVVGAATMTAVIFVSPTVLASVSSVWLRVLLGM